MKKKYKNLVISCDGGAASGKTTGAKLISKKYNLKFLSSGLLYRYVAYLLLKTKTKNKISFLSKKFKNLNYKKLNKINLQSPKISEYSAVIAKNKDVREIMKKFQKKIIKKNKRICVEGRDIASTILKKNPRYDLAFYFTCNLNLASIRRWKDLEKKVPLKEVKKSLSIRTKLDKKRKHSPLKKMRDAILIKTDKLNKKKVLIKMSQEIEKINYKIL